MPVWMNARQVVDYLNALGVIISINTIRRAMIDGRIETEYEERVSDSYVHRGTACCHVRDALDSGRIKERK